MKFNWAAISVLMVVFGSIGGVAFVEYSNIRVLQKSMSDLALSHRQLVDEYIALKNQIRDGRERLTRVETLAHQHSKKLSHLEMHAGVE